MSLHKWMKNEEENTKSDMIKAEKAIALDEKEAKDRVWRAIGFAFLSGLACGYAGNFHVGVIVTTAFVIGAWAVTTTKNKYIKKILINDFNHEKRKLYIIQSILEKLERE